VRIRLVSAPIAIFQGKMLADFWKVWKKTRVNQPVVLQLCVILFLGSCWICGIIHAVRHFQHINILLHSVIFLYKANSTFLMSFHSNIIYIRIYN
jgi:hypothetical protein